MPAPSLPTAVGAAEARPGDFDVGGRRCRMWVRRDGPARQKIFVDIETNIPLSVTDEYFEEGGEGSGEGAAVGVGADGPASSSTSSSSSRAPTRGKWVAVMTYTWEGISIGPPPESAFAIAEPWGAHEECERHVGGWPYLHLFHTFLRV
jgi:hypothetical protein